MKNYLYFENDLKKMESELEKLKNPYNEGGLTEVDTKKISVLEKEIEDKLKKITLAYTQLKNKLRKK